MSGSESASVSLKHMGSAVYPFTMERNDLVCAICDVKLYCMMSIWVYLVVI